MGDVGYMHTDRNITYTHFNVPKSHTKTGKGEKTDGERYEKGRRADITEGRK